MANIICSIPNPLDATSLYRGLGPFMTMKRLYPNIDMVLNPDLSWANLKAADFCFFQRPAFQDRVSAMKIAKTNGKPLWIDYDDNLHAIPTCNRRYNLYGDPQVQHNIAIMTAMADVVTVTTEHLAASLRNLLRTFPSNDGFITDPSKVIVIPNAYDPELMPDLTKPRRPRNKLVVWRGSDSHAKDLHVYAQAIGETARLYADWGYEFIGEPFWLAIEAIKKLANPNTLTVTAPQDPVNFFRYLQSQAPTLVIVPLEDISFNHSKSNIAWLEATAAGAIVLAPNWPEWQKPGIINYTDIENFGVRFQAILRGEFDLDSLWAQSRDHILSNLSLRDVNKTRYTLVERLASWKWDKSGKDFQCPPHSISTPSFAAS